MVEPTPLSAPPKASPVRTGSPGEAGEAVRLAAAYGWLLRPLLGWAFGPVQVPPELGPRLHALAQRGTVVYVGRSAAFVTFLFFQHLALRLGAPVAQAVVGMGARLWQPWGRLVAGRWPARAPFGEDAGAAVRAGRSAFVFLRKPGSLVASVMGLKDPFPALVAAQRLLARPILLVPQLLIWERRPPTMRRTLLDVLFGEPEAPGLWRSLLAFLTNRRRAFVKAGEPIDLQAVLAEHAGLEDEVVARKVRGALSQHLARETRVVTGPRLKTPERLIEETLRERSLRGTLAEVARERGRADGSVEREAEKDLREIAARYSGRTIEFMKWLLDIVFERIYDGVEVDAAGLERVRRVSAQMPIIMCPSHKSHIDYLVMSHVFYTEGLITPHIAAGINLDFWPVGTLFRKSGAFFIRRSFKGDKVYGAVLKAYIRKLLKDGFSQEFFVEGGRSRTGKVLLPKFGMLAMEVDAWVDGVRPDVAFVPSWIGYAQIIEAKSYAHELGGGEKKAEDLGALLRAPQVLTSRYGRVYIRFDEPLSLALVAKERAFDREHHTEEQKRALVRALGFRIVDGINRATALTPSGLLCTALLAHDQRGLAAPDLVDRMEFLLRLVRDAGGALSFTYEPGALDPLGQGPIHEARLALEREKQLVHHQGGGEHIFQVPDESRIALDYQKNTALHFFVPDALLATALLTTPGAARPEVQARTLALSRLLKQEFIYAPGTFQRLFERRVARFVELGILAETDGVLAATAAGAARLRLLADLLVNFVEGYASAAEALGLLLKGPMDAREFVRTAMDRTRAAFLAGRLRKFESRSKVMLESAMALFEEQGVLVRAGDRGRQRALAPAHAKAELVQARVAGIRTFLVGKAS